MNHTFNKSYIQRMIWSTNSKFVIGGANEPKLINYFRQSCKYAVKE